MPTEVRLLIVEDDEGVIAGWNRSIDFHNADESSGFEIRHTVAVSLEEATTALAENDFDAAVVDIRLQGNGGALDSDDSGNEVLELVLKGEMAIVAAFTGEPRSVVVPAGAQRVRTFEKGGGNKPIVQWLAEHLIMIRHIRASQRQIKRKMASVFVQSIWPRWANWLNAGAELSQQDVQTALTRHIVSHVLTSLMIESNQKAHAEEWYFVPPIGNQLMTGDILEDNGSFEIVITPRCDVTQGKNSTVQLARCDVCADAWKSAVTKAKENKKNSFSDMSTLLQHNRRVREHFLPPMKRNDGSDAGPFLVQFSCIHSIDALEAEVLLSKRIASLTPEFLPSLIERLGAYFSRIGTPDYLHIKEES